MFGSLTWVERRGGGIYGEVRDISLEALFRSEGRFEEDGSLFELEFLAKDSSSNDRSKDISVKSYGDGDCEGNEDILTNF